MDGNDLVVLGLLLMVGPHLLLAYLSLGPVGWLAIGGLFVIVGIVVGIRHSTVDEGDESATGWNCPACGARNSADTSGCHHCGVTLGADDAKGVSRGPANGGP